MLMLLVSVPNKKNSARACYNKADNSISGLRPDIFKAALKKVPLGEKTSTNILKDLSITINTKKNNYYISKIFFTLQMNTL